MARAADDKLLAEWFWTDRWMGSSAFLLPLEPRGLYREMLTQAWRRGARLPNDPEAIRRAVGCTEKEWRANWPTIERYWRIDGDGLVNDTQAEVYAKALAVHQQAVERGRKGGKARARALAKTEVRLEASSQDQLQVGLVNQGQLERKPPSPSPDRTPERTPVSGRARDAAAAGVRSLESLKADSELCRRAGDFAGERYPQIFRRCRNGARFVARPVFDFEDALPLVATWDDARLDVLAEAFLTTDDPFCRNGSGTIKHFASRASWCDSRLRERGL
jgi:uncharacterized protein YdaU (DUF1376 family)